MSADWFSWRKRQANGVDAGFTLLELLVTIVVIGVLTAIAIPMLLNQRKSAADAAAKSDLRTLAIEVYTRMVIDGVDPSKLLVVQVDTTGIEPYYSIVDMSERGWGDNDVAAQEGRVGAISDGVLLTDSQGESVNQSFMRPPDSEGRPLSARSAAELVALGTVSGTPSTTDWCFGVKATGGAAKAMRFSMQHGLEVGKVCADQ